MGNLGRDAGNEVHEGHPQQSEAEGCHDKGPESSEKTVVVLAQNLVGGGIGVFEAEIGGVDSG